MTSRDTETRRFLRRGSVPDTALAMNPKLQVLFVPLALAACSPNPTEMGQKAGALYMIPFGMSLTETLGKPCPERLKVAKELSAGSVDKRKEIGAKASSVATEEAFKSALAAVTKDRKSMFERFAKECPAEAKEAIPVFEQVEEQLGIKGVLPALQATAE